MGTHLSLALLNDLANDGQSEADALMIQLCCSLQLTEAREELGQVLSVDPRACVLHMHDERFLEVVVLELDLNDAI